MGGLALKAWLMQGLNRSMTALHGREPLVSTGSCNCCRAAFQKARDGVWHCTSPAYCEAYCNITWPSLVVGMPLLSFGGGRPQWRGQPSLDASAS